MSGRVAFIPNRARPTTRGRNSNEERFMAIENRLSVVEISHAEIKEDTAAILSALKGASVIGTFIKKHGPRAFAFSMGVLVASGYVSPETAKHVLHLLGL